MKIDRYGRFPLPKTVDEAVTILISELSARQREAIGYMTDELFEALCHFFAPTIHEDFRLWSGNDKLLMDCMDRVNDITGTDPMGIIMGRMRECLMLHPISKY